jgi:hypothetical protein
MSQQMSVINSNPFAGALTPGPTLSEFENGSAPPAGTSLAAYGRSDDIAPSPWMAAPAAASGGIAGMFSDPSSAWSFTSVMNNFMSTLSNLLGSLGSSLGGSTGTSPSAPSLPGVPSPAPQPGTSGSGETYYSSATAASIGDPHDAFVGTSASGNKTDDRWDNMSAHGDLLDSDSFSGGYRIATTVTQPRANGITFNGSATITTNGGATSVTYNADGSYSILSNGRSVSLQQGVATSLGNGESVTLGADGSLTVSDANGSGGSISTVLSRNGSGGVDIHATATDVDLGGYLAHGGAAYAGPPAGTSPQPAPAPAAPGVPPWPTLLSQPATSPATSANANASALETLDPFGIGL